MWNTFFPRPSEAFRGMKRISISSAYMSDRSCFVLSDADIITRDGRPRVFNSRRREESTSEEIRKREQMKVLIFAGGKKVRRRKIRKRERPEVFDSHRRQKRAAVRISILAGSLARRLKNGAEIRNRLILCIILRNRRIRIIICVRNSYSKGVFYGCTNIDSIL